MHRPESEPPPSDLAARIALWGERLRDIAARGLLFSRDPYDRENYAELRELAIELAAAARGVDPASFAPLRDTLYARPTPLASGDAAIIDDNGRILLIRRADSAHWAMPGGGLAVGESPAEGVVREAFEETGQRCEPLRLVGLYDSRYRGTRSRFHLYQVLFLCRPVGEPIAEPAHAREVLEQGWFAADALPTPLEPGHPPAIRDAFAMWRGERRESHFDPVRGGEW